ncbi:MAG TPA: prephenate dehydrogenase/arogenate dehydrogenase family protein [Candidatus Methanomethylicus sp.]|nr:prephenate dehydrogenase/arogenate dehydrogenase family protein [Candidatus Methanomethylicus sp.]
MAALLRGSCDLTIMGRDAGKAKAVAGRMGIMGGAPADLPRMDVVVLTVPTGALLSSARETSSLMKAGSLLVDISSVKCGVVEEICSALPDGVFFISIHPLFASPHVRVKNAIVVPVRPGPWMPALTGLLTRAGMRVREASAEEHDRVMATVQVIPHFALLSIKEAIARARGDFAGDDDLEPFLTHNIIKIMRTIGLIDRNIATIEMIQRENKYATAARKAFIEEAAKLDAHYSRRNA